MIRLPFASLASAHVTELAGPRPRSEDRDRGITKVGAPQGRSAAPCHLRAVAYRSSGISASDRRSQIVTLSSAQLGAKPIKRAGTADVIQMPFLIRKKMRPSASMAAQSAVKTTGLPCRAPTILAVPQSQLRWTNWRRPRCRPVEKIASSWSLAVP